MSAACGAELGTPQQEHETIHPCPRAEGMLQHGGAVVDS